MFFATKKLTSVLLLTFAQYIIEVLIRLETYVTLEQIILFHLLRLLLV